MAVRRPEPLSFTHSLAYTYLFMAHHGDREGLTKEEIAKIVQKVSEWNDYLTPGGKGSVDITMQEVDATWRYFCDLQGNEETEELALHIGALNRFLPDGNKKAVIADLVAIAQADGRVSDSERKYIELVHTHLGLA